MQLESVSSIKPLDRLDESFGNKEAATELDKHDTDDLLFEKDYLHLNKS